MNFTLNYRSPLFEDFIGAHEDIRRNGQAEFLGGF
jgi:hypothetical protein